MAMANSSTFILFLNLIVLPMLAHYSGVVESSVDGLSWVPAKGRCRGSIGECMREEVEFEMESETNRRILATTEYISYDALSANTIPCSVTGASYYNCQPGAEANPYDRGCSAIARCRS